MRAPDGTVLIDGAHDGVRPLSPGEQAAFDAMPIDVGAVLGQLGVDGLEPPRDLGYYQRLSRPTFTINSLTCEDASEHRTVIPNVAVAKCDMRLVGGQRSEDVIDAIRGGMWPGTIPGVQVSFSAIMAPQRTLPENAYTEAVMRGARAGLAAEPRR